MTHPKELWQLVTKSARSWSDDFAPSMGAAISYYTVFSIAPLLLIIIAVAGLVLGREAASGQIFAQLQGLLGDEGATAIQGMVKSASSSGKSTIATIIGVVTLLLGATTVFGELQTSLDRIWKTPAAAKTEGLWQLLRTRVLSFGMILAIGFLLLISLAASAALAAMGKWWSPLFGGSEVLLQIANLVFSFIVITVLFALIYKFLPRVRIAWHDVWIGAAVTALLFTIGKTLIGLYIGKSGVASGFGAAGSLVVLLVWVYYSAQIFLLGAEFTWVYAYEHGSRKGEAMDNSAIASRKDAAAVAVPASRQDRGERKPASLGPAARAVTATLDRYPKAELGIAAGLGALAALAAFWRGRLR
ncbi:MAG: YihY/virulence factor BrkB family protein [Pseudomonadota bacterium]|nr:YihY/virulence factor BrkB family protein [Pseudomonadota bacterium]